MRSRSWSPLTLLVLLLSVPSLLVLPSCNKPEIEDCRRACLNYNKVMFWDRVDMKVKDLKPGEAAAIRAQSELEYQEIVQREEDPNLLNCITNCQNDANREQVVCLQEQSTAATIKACLD